jgi:hypothetical protein
MGTRGCAETSVSNCDTTLRNITEEREDLIYNTDHTSVQMYLSLETFWGGGGGGE